MLDGFAIRRLTPAGIGRPVPAASFDDGRQKAKATAKAGGGFSLVLREGEIVDLAVDPDPEFVARLRRNVTEFQTIEHLRFLTRAVNRAFGSVSSRDGDPEVCRGGNRS